MDLIVYSHDIQATRQRMIRVALRRFGKPIKGHKFLKWRDEGRRRPVFDVPKVPVRRNGKKTVTIVRGPTEEEIQSIPGLHVIGHVDNDNYVFKAAGEVFKRYDDDDNPVFFSKSGEQLYRDVVGNRLIGLLM